jgi:flagellar basal-body rod protein FlgF
MDRLIYTAMTGASGTMARLASVAHNLANVSTSGYRAEEHRLRAVQVLSPALPTRAFAVDASTHTDYSSGPMQFTGRPYDVAIQGQGWLAVQTPDGREAYTRSGDLEINLNGVLQTRSGYPVTGDAGAISIPPDSKVSIGRDGTISVIPQTGAQNSVNVLGRIKLVNPPVADLQRGEDGLFRVNGGAAAPLDESVSITSGYLEGSNVNPVEQMVSMISLSRQFEMNMKILTAENSNDQSATQILTNL